MRGRLLLVLLICVPVTALLAQEPNDAILGQTTGNPLADYLLERDRLGRILCGWEAGDSISESWLFGAQAMLILGNHGADDTQHFPGLVAVVPELWSDVKYLTPRYLVELAGGALSSGDMMCLLNTIAPEKLQLEERLIRQIAGYSHLRMLYATVGDSLYQDILERTIQCSATASDIPENLIRSVALNCGAALAQEFWKVLDGKEWIDVDLVQIDQGTDTLRLEIQFIGEINFPLEVMVVTASSDTLFYPYDDFTSGFLSIPGTGFKQVELDPRHILSEYYRFNNHWPRLVGHIRLQPFVALPDWENYRILVSPSTWSDWDGSHRYGLKFSSGFGLDLWPAYPSDFRHRIILEMNAHTPLDQNTSWGTRLKYFHPLSLKRRLFAQAKMHGYDDWQGLSLGLTKYIGDQTFLIQESRLFYHRLEFSIEHDKYGDADVWYRKQNIGLVKAAYTDLSLTKYGDRMYLTIVGAYGIGPESEFWIGKSQLDISGVFWNWLVGDFHLVSGMESTTTPEPYQFTHVYTWQDRLSAMPAFRGQTKISETTHGYLGLGLSGGYWLSWVQVKLFGSSMVYAANDISFGDVTPRYAAGFGFEHKSFFTAGLYFPVWQSVPLEGENPWQWRYQWRFSWNL